MRNDPLIQGPVTIDRRLRRRAWRRLFAAALLGSALAGTWSHPANAAEDDVTIGMARERFKEGVQYFDQKQYDKARAAFLQAYALKRHPAVLLNLAQSELRSGHEADAAKHFAQYLREHKEASETERQGAEAGLGSAKALVGELHLSSDEEGATVLVDGATEGVTPLPGPIYLKPGVHAITLRKDGRESSAHAQAVAGQTSSLNLRMKKSSQAAAPATAAPRKQDEAEPSEPEQPSSAAPDVEEEPEAPGRDRPPFFAWVADTPIAWVGTGLVVGGIAGGLVAGFSAKNRYDNANAISSQIEDEAASDGIPNATGICTDQGLAMYPGLSMGRRAQYREACSAYRDKANEGDQLKTLAVVGGTVAGVALVGTVLLYYFTSDPSGEDADAARASRPRSSRVTARLVPWASPEAGGLVVGGEF